MKLRIEISDDCEDEVVIRCKSVNDTVRQLEAAFGAAIGAGGEMVLKLGDAEHFVKMRNILFFETDNGRVAAHTSDRMYYTERKLYELEQSLPRSFVRVSKSCIINSSLVSSITKNIAGLAEATFQGTHKKVSVSRMYYKILMQTIAETRFTR